MLTRDRERCFRRRGSAFSFCANLAFLKLRAVRDVIPCIPVLLLPASVLSLPVFLPRIDFNCVLNRNRTRELWR
jgi:hypothetical protein